jgi:fluoride exporter
MQMWQQYFMVALGGAVGSLARWQLASLVTRAAGDYKFPLGTFVVNVIGCLIMGALAGYAAKHGEFSTNARLLLFTGLMGGFTTFSAFGLETFELMRRGQVLIAGSNVVLSVVLGVVGLWVGYWVAGG